MRMVRPMPFAAAPAGSGLPGHGPEPGAEPGAGAGYATCIRLTTAHGKGGMAGTET